MHGDHHVMICIGNMVNAAFIPDNFDDVLWVVEIMIVSNEFVEICYI